MFVPDFINEVHGEFILVASHSLASPESIKLSIAYNIARISYGLSQLPSHIQTCRVVYDIRGQSISDLVLAQIKEAFEQVAIVEFKF
ncbi:hypothetical protein C1N60_21150 (plasmid) [Pantoea sp. SGAir0184]|uniref:hypothetical protein n=1 Tax=Pantoea TaxID=53335 RepID=UPI000CE4821F|nr:MULTISPECIES: hypothetical protein [Pantoea]KAF0855997.1 hypothetical protein Y788_05820 [Pantoea dispersa 625]PPC71842.1 hypothetical protein C1Y42_11460 [Pantoea sp. ICBG 985]KAA8673641.1 hypothetical protein F4W08_01295 [Pantoea dispersa]MBS0899291.1 hypothetical protein [Pantoea dispersa]THD39248.1 hypothetical protein ERD80_08900 [Pantoea sp. R102]